MNDLKKQLYKELEVKNGAVVEGINVHPGIFKHLSLGKEHQEQVHFLFERDYEQHVGVKLPFAYTTPSGLNVPFRWDRRSRYSIIYENDKYYLTRNGEPLFPVEFHKRPKYYDRKTSDGVLMQTVAPYQADGCISVAYSNECALRDKGQECLFCNINATKEAYGEHEGIYWKTPRQIGETVAAAFAEGAHHVNITGGFIPERREVDYYVDVAEAIKEHTGLAEFNGHPVIGAPLDLGVIEKYKEVGYRCIALNIEIWDKNIFKSICPGKEADCGGWEHWVKALEYSVQVFGRGRVRSNIVAGIEPKKSILEGVEYLASVGVVCFVNPWCPNPGSVLEGHRTPDEAWHFDLAKKAAAIHRKAGFTYENLYDCAGTSITTIHDIYKIEDELLPVFRDKAG